MVGGGRSVILDIDPALVVALLTLGSLTGAGSFFGSTLAQTVPHAVQ